jgi:hypothetical protein
MLFHLVYHVMRFDAARRFAGRMRIKKGGGTRQQAKRNRRRGKESGAVIGYHRFVNAWIVLRENGATR